jgi:protein PhnA
VTCAGIAIAATLIIGPLQGSSQVLKGGSKSEPIKLVDGDHEFCGVDGIAVGLKACFVKKA